MPKKGYKPTEEHKAKLSAARIGNQNNLGNKASDATKQKMSNAHKKRYEDPKERILTSESTKGIPKSDHMKAALSAYRTGKHHTEETKEKIRLAHLGVRPSEEHRTKLSKSKTGNTYRVGKKDSEETKIKKSNATKKENNPNWKGGITPLGFAIRSLPIYEAWRKSVFERDGYKDWFSGCTGILVAHHIIYFNKLLKEYNIQTVEDAEKCVALWDINNGITMLKTSHDFYHDIHGKDGWLFQGNVLTSI